MPYNDAELFVNEYSFREWSSSFNNQAQPKKHCSICNRTEIINYGNVHVCDHCGNVYFLDDQGRERRSLSTKTKVNELIETSKQLHASSQYAKELNVLYEALNLDDTDIEIVNKLGRCNRTLYRYDLAMNFYNLAIKMNPNYGPAYNNIGVICLIKKEYEAAKQYFEKGLPLTDQSEYDYWLAQAHYAVAIAKLGDPERAEKLISEAESRGYKYGDDKREMAGLPKRT